MANLQEEVFRKKRQEGASEEKEATSKTSVEVYISEENRVLAEQLAMKGYASHRLKDLHAEKRALEAQIALQKKFKCTEQYLGNHPGAAELLIPKLKSQSDYVQEWQASPYSRSSEHPENLKYSTVIPDLKVRSKAEADIVSRLVNFGVPFRYEEQVIVGNCLLHPDFTCLNAKTRKIYYWEHQGGWDQHHYVATLDARMELLNQVGIIPWKNLLITTETYQQPLDINWVDCLIHYYLL